MRSAVKTHVCCLLAVGLMAAPGACKKSAQTAAPTWRSAERLEWAYWREGEKLELQLDARDTDVLWLKRRGDVKPVGGGRQNSVSPGVQQEAEHSGAEDEKPSLVYRFDSATGKLTRETEQAWDAAGGEVRQCWIPQRHLRAVHRDSPSSKLKRGDEFIATAGEYVDRVRGPRGGKHLVVVSGDGPLKGVTYVGWGTARPAGQHYHQTYSVEKGAFVGESVRLPFAPEPAMSLCIAPQERYAVYYNRDSSLCVIAIAPEGE
jgi:hypothetical protein